MKVLLFALLVSLGATFSALASCPTEDFDTVDPANKLDLVEFVKCVNKLKNEIVPKDAVVAFDRADGCPVGWVEFKEASRRVIIGTSSDTPYRKEGGSQKIDIERKVLREYGNIGNEFKYFYIVGASEAADLDMNMQPFLALHYCKKNDVKILLHMRPRFSTMTP